MTLDEFARLVLEMREAQQACDRFTRHNELLVRPTEDSVRKERAVDDALAALHAEAWAGRRPPL